MDEGKLELVRVCVEHRAWASGDAEHPKDVLRIELEMPVAQESQNDDIVIVMHDRSCEFYEAVMPTVGSAFDRIVLDRLRKGQYRWARHDGQAQPAHHDTAEIEDIEI